MKKLTLLLLLCAIASPGFAGQAIPNIIGGHYYMAGDDVCAQYRVLSETRIMCLDSAGNEEGYRDAMTNADVQMYQYQQQAQAQQIDALNAQIQATNTQLGAWSAQMLNSTRQYAPPQAMPIQPQGGNVIRCISTDIYTNCRY